MHLLGIIGTGCFKRREHLLNQIVLFFKLKNTRICSVRLRKIIKKTLMSDEEFKRTFYKWSVVVLKTGVPLMTDAH